MISSLVISDERLVFLVWINTAPSATIKTIRDSARLFSFILDENLCGINRMTKIKELIFVYGKRYNCKC